MPYRHSVVPSSSIQALHVDVQNADDVQFWCENLQCTEAELRQAAEQVGPNVGAIMRYIAGHYDIGPLTS